VEVDIIIYSFAGGCLLATAGFLMLPEASHMISAGGFSESKASTIYGSCVLGGYLIGLIIHGISGIVSKSPARSGTVTPGEAEQSDVEENLQSGDRDREAGELQVVLEDSSVKAVVWSILWGDFFHNFVDGIAIGTAFINCEAATGWAVVFSSMAHEVSQEIADFLILTKNGFRPHTAVLANLLSGLSCVIGGVVAVYSDFSSHVSGGILAFGAGTYIWIAATESLPKIVHMTKWRELSISLTSFLLGALFIGLVLINHEHCEVGGGEGGADPHAGHGH